MADPESVMAVLRGDGLRFGLTRQWHLIEALQEEERFSCAQIAGLFAECSRVLSIDAGQYRSTRGEGDKLPMSTRVVQLFSNFVCERIHDLSAAEITTFIVALTSPSLPMDEFWLFMMAKRVQDTAESYSADQVVTIAQCYADKGLEDEEFFGALSASVVQRMPEFGLPRLSIFLLACANVRFLSDDLCLAVAPLLEDPAVVGQCSGEAISRALAAAALLDQQFFNPSACCRRIVASPADFAHLEHIMGLALAVGALRHSSLARLLTPSFLPQLAKSLASRRLQGRKALHEFGRIHRRLLLVGLCAAFGVPRPVSWPLSSLKDMRGLLDVIDQRLGQDASVSRGSYEPASSSFHLEVVAVLRLIDVEHVIEHRQIPFCLDIAVFPADGSRTAAMIGGARPTKSRAAENFSRFERPVADAAEVSAASMALWAGIA